MRVRCVANGYLGATVPFAIAISDRYEFRHGQPLMAAGRDTEHTRTDTEDRYANAHKAAHVIEDRSSGSGHNKSNMLHLLLWRHPKGAPVGPANQALPMRRSGCARRGSASAARAFACIRAGLVPHPRGTPITSASMPGASRCIALSPENFWRIRHSSPRRAVPLRAGERKRQNRSHHTFSSGGASSREARGKSPPFWQACAKTQRGCGNPRLLRIF